MKEYQDIFKVGGLIKGKIIPREENYYFVTETELRDIRSKSIWADIFLFLSSLAGTSFFSTLLIKLSYKGEGEVIPSVLNFLQWMCLILFTLFFIIALSFWKGRRDVINKIIKTPKVKLQENEAITRISGSFDDSQEINSDTLQNFMDFYFPEKSKSSIKDIIALVQELKKHGETFKTLQESHKKTKKYLEVIEKEIFKDGMRLQQHQVVRNVILDLTNDSYWQGRKREQNPNVVKLKERIRRELSLK